MIATKSSAIFTFMTVPIICGALVTAACSSRKHLTPSTARPMVQEIIDKRNDGFFLVDYSRVAALVNQKTLTNYKQGNYKNGSTESVLHRLIQTGLVNQSNETVTWPDVTGEYEGNFWALTLRPVSLLMKQGSPAIKGTFQGFYLPSGKKPQCQGSVSGWVSKNRVVTLRFQTQITRGWVDKHGIKRPSNCNIRKVMLKVKRSGDVTELIEIDRITNFSRGPLDLRGRSAGGQIKAVQYIYSFSPQYLAMVASPGSKLKAGRIRVYSVEGLLLGPAETMAEGKFKWAVDFNHVAEALTGVPGAFGTGSLEFRKQPDGDWVCVGVRLNR